MALWRYLYSVLIDLLLSMGLSVGTAASRVVVVVVDCSLCDDDDDDAV